MLTEFDYAVIAYAQSIGVGSAVIYQQINKLLSRYRNQYTEAQLMAALTSIKNNKE